MNDEFYKFDKPYLEKMVRTIFSNVVKLKKTRLDTQQELYVDCIQDAILDIKNILCSAGCIDMSHNSSPYE